MNGEKPQLASLTPGKYIQIKPPITSPGEYLKLTAWDDGSLLIETIKSVSGVVGFATPVSVSVEKSGEFLDSLELFIKEARKRAKT